LVLFHHDPLHTDADLDAMLAGVQRMPAATGLEVELAFEGQAFELPPA
jgi:hypothetical protein